MDRLTQFFEEVKSISIWKRLFGWSQVRALSYDAYQEYKLLEEKVGVQDNQLSELNNEITVLKTENKHLSESKPEVASLREKISNLQEKNTILEKENLSFKQAESSRQTELDKKIALFTSSQQRVEEERKNEIEENQKKEIERLEGLKKTWSEHQDRVKEQIKSICQKHTIEYIESVPFRGAPDNTLKIADEFVVFDAKSPAAEDLTNFPVYVKDQAEKAKKYIKEEGVKRDVFLVVPSNTVRALRQFVYNLPDYNVFVITLDALEPVILSLKKIEEYEFIDQLSPEDRDNIARVVGKFAYHIKRRVQIDQFFDWQSLELLTKTSAELPGEILDKAIEYEKAEKLNPPTDRRTKLLPSEQLKKDSVKIQKEAEVKEIIFPQDLKIEE
ncbi:MAG: hypothetical protein KGI70_02530 [Patescibacteria group bacterium]|nr:hypothetical protein [Patescibacteria group bacterium]